jgi:hypothetical protein
LVHCLWWVAVCCGLHPHSHHGRERVRDAVAGKHHLSGKASSTQFR